MKRARGMLAIAVFGLAAVGAVGVRAEQVSGHGAVEKAAQIQGRLNKDPDLKNNRIEVSVDNGIATLKGTVDTDAEKERAAQLAMVKGVVGVQNQLDVGSAGAGEAVSDSAITAKIKGKLAESHLGSLTGVSVTTNNGVVTLSGTVPTERERQQALDAARTADGVMRVENDITVTPKR
jgi:hyperosmotically inducible protein